MIKLSQQINEIREGHKNLYLNPTALLFREGVQQEHKLKKQYKSREIFELLQNIDDEYDPKSIHPCIADFRLNGRWLEVSNYGKPFTIDTLKRLCQGSVSIKHGGVIGCKGIGFRSVLNWADRIEIFSGKDDDYISVGFSEDYASDLFHDIESDPHISSQIEELNRINIPPHYPMLKAPFPIDPIDKTFDTVIRLHIKNDISYNKIVEDMKSFDPSVILFMPHIERITFHGDKINRKIIEKINEEDGTVNVIEKSSDSQPVIKKYLFKEKECIAAREYKGANIIKMAIALPIDSCTEKTYNLYSYFPIIFQDSPFKALLHATFCLTDNRNELDISAEEEREVNKEVFLQLLDFYVSTVCEVKSGKERISMLKPNNFSAVAFKFNGALASLKCEEDYLNLCKKAKLFHTVTDDYITSADKPVFLSSCPNHFGKSESFSKVVEYQKDYNLIPFSRWICGENQLYANTANETYLFNAINSESTNWTVEERIETFKWWNDIDEFKRLPYLLRNFNGNFIESQTEACFLSGNITNTPEWARITILDKTDEEELLKVFRTEIENKRKGEEASKRVLPRLIREELLNLQQQTSRRVMISPVNNSVDNDFNRAVSFVRWLIEISDSEEKIDLTTSDDVQFNLPTALHTVAHANRMYFGKEYGNTLAEEIFGRTKTSSLTEEYAAIASFETLFPDNETDIDTLISILSQAGVTMYPRTKMVETKNINYQCPELSYIQHLLSSNSIPQNVKHYNSFLLSIPSLNQILSELKTSTIIKWLDKDSRLVENRFEPDESTIEYKPRVQGQIYARKINFTGHLPSFILYVISTTKWVSIHNQFYAPQQILITDDDFIPAVYPASLPENAIFQLAEKSGCTPGRIKALLKAAGAKESILELSSNDFYGILLKISQQTENSFIEKSYKFSRRLYRDIIQNGRSADKLTGFYQPSENQSKFFNSGKVLAQKQRGEKCYRDVSEVFFANSAIIDISERYFIDIPPRSGQKEDFKTIFNIKSYSQDYKVLNFSSALSNTSFQKYYREFLPYLMSFRLNDINEINNLVIELIDNVEVESDNHIHTSFEPYTVFRKNRNHRLILVDASLSFHDLDRKQIALRLEDIFNEFFNFPSRNFLSKVSQFFITDKNTRDFFISSEFGSDDEYLTACKKLNINNELCQKIADSLDQHFPANNCRKLIEKVNWTNPTTVESQKVIHEIIKSSGCLSVKALSKITGLTLTLREYNSRLIDECYKIYFSKYRGIIHHHLSLNPNLRKNYIQILDKFNKPSLPKDKTDEVSFDAHKLISEKMCQLLAKIGLNDQEPSDPETEIEKIYKQNHTRLLNHAGQEKVDLVNDFLNYPNPNKSLMFFADFDVIKETFDKFEQERVNSSENEDNNNFNFSDYLQSATVDNQTTGGTLPCNRQNKGTTVVSGSHTGIDRQNRRQGDIAEYLALVNIAEGKIKEIDNYLGSDYSIKWRSGAAKRIPTEKNILKNCITSETDDSLGYDIELQSADGKRKLLIEVKSSTSSECVFIMSQNEYARASQCASNKYDEKYRIIFVSNLNVGNPSNIKISYLDYDIDDYRFITKHKDVYVAFNSPDDSES